MNTLNPDRINAGISVQLFTAAHRLVLFNNEIDKSLFYQDFYFHGVIEVSSVKRSRCSILMLYEDKGKYCCEEEQFDLSFLPPKLIRRMKRQKKMACHVLIHKRIGINSKYDDLKTTLIVPVGEKNIGHFSNHIILDDEGMKYLNGFFKKLDLYWLNTPTPRYKALKKFKKIVQDSIAKTKKLYPAILSQTA